ncbi:MAG: RNA polymerase sigma factor [Acidimicrobiia bacterium]|nr:RNA polymerase sigma factor [Acidimicrobiia bacterium]
MTAEIEETLRIEGGPVLATLIRFTGDIDLAEDALQDAALVALRRWGEIGVPENPAAWLTTVARNKALDRLRREARRTDKEAEAMRMLADPGAAEPGTDLLRLLFTCCHPALAPEARIALALRTLSGLTTREIARAFLVAEPTMGQRISRAKRKIADARIPYRVPADHELPERLPTVLAVLYLIFTTGHHAPEGALTGRVELTDEAIRLTRMLHGLMPDEAEVSGLLALMIATRARRDARTDGAGDLVVLADQDRTRWDREAIAEADLLLRRAIARRDPGPYQIQAAIACLHGEAASHDDTDWEQIARLYRSLEALQPTAVVRVNRAVAETMVHGPEAGLALLDDVEGLEAWHLLWSTRAALYRRLGRLDEAAKAYRRALDLDMNETDRRFLERCLAEVDASEV